MTPARQAVMPASSTPRTTARDRNADALTREPEIREWLGTKTGELWFFSSERGVLPAQNTAGSGDSVPSNPET